MIAFVVSGVLAAVAGIILSAQLDAGQGNFGQSNLLDAIAAVVIGGCSLNGGSGTFVGTAAGVLMITSINNGLVIVGVSPFWVQIVVGLIILAAVMTDRLARGERTRASAFRSPGGARDGRARRQDPDGARDDRSGGAGNHASTRAPLRGHHVPRRGARRGVPRGRAYHGRSLENLGWIRYNYFRNFDNSRLTDEDTALSELDLFRRAGGGTIVEVTTAGIGRDPIALARVARASGVNIVMSTGWYVDPTHPPSVSVASEEKLVSRMVTEIRDGAVLERPSAPGHDVTRSDVHTDVRAGVIKVGCSYPLTIDGRR